MTRDPQHIREGAVEHPFGLSPERCIKMAQFISAVTGADSEREIFVTLADSLRHLVTNDRASVTLLTPAGDQLEVYSLHGREGVLPVGKTLPVAGTFAGLAVQELATQYHLLDAQTASIDGQLLYREGMRCIINVPLLLEGAAIGTINTATTDPAGFGSDVLNLLQVVARLVAVNLERQRLLEEKTQAVTRYQFYVKLLEHLNILTQRLLTVASLAEALHLCETTLQQIVPAQRVSYAAFDPESRCFWITVLSGADPFDSRCLVARGSALEAVMQSIEPIYCADLSQSPYTEQRRLSAEGLNSSWSIPVRVEGAVIAVLNLAMETASEVDNQLQDVLAMLGAVLGSTLERLQIQDKLIHQADHDTVTDLPNRNALYRQVNLLLAQQPPTQFSILFVDLDRFKVVNDTLGHQVGDELLCLVAKRIKQVVRSSDLVARVGGDEFVILVKESDGCKRSTTTAERVIRVVSSPFDIGGKNIQIGASIGISHACPEIQTVEALIKEADFAMYAAKSAGRNTYRSAPSCALINDSALTPSA